MQFPRASGILLHITSLPGPYGVGDLGPAALRFVDFLAAAKQNLWQVLPIGPTGYGESPYQSPSSFAGNTLLVSLDCLADDGWLPKGALEGAPQFAAEHAEFARVRAWREPLLQQAFAAFRARQGGNQAAAFATFRHEHAWWLDEYALFTALKSVHPDCAWTGWEPGLIERRPAALQAWKIKLADRIEFECFLQFQFARQWQTLKDYAHANQVKIIGDVPIFAAHDSADAWANQELFELHADGRAKLVAGVPPDYFSETGQLWGNPLYRWDVHARQKYAWWIKRLARAFALYDFVRIDHFRGFESYWEVPGDAPDARGGHWVPGPGAALFHAAAAALGPLPVIAEDLGLITPEVEELRDSLGLPGMRVLQFAFGDDPKGLDYRPHNYIRHCVAYTGTHDNDTTFGWFTSEAGEGSTRTQEQVDRERGFTLEYLHSDGREVHWDMIRSAFGSVADLAVAPMQDVLGLGNEARMNLPGTAVGNWKWRARGDAFTPPLAQRLARLSELYERPKNRPPETVPSLATDTPLTPSRSIS